MDPLSKENVESACKIAGFQVLRVWRLPNQYYTYSETEDRETTMREAVYREKRPSWLVKTQYGLIQFNLRKRVVEIDWSDTPVRVLITTDQVTKELTYVHAWDTLKMMEYLSALKTNLEVGALSSDSTTGNTVAKLATRI